MGVRESFQLNKDDELINPATKESVEDLKQRIIYNDKGSSFIYGSPVEIDVQTTSKVIDFTPNESVNIVKIWISGTSDCKAIISINDNDFLEGMNSVANKNIDFNLQEAKIILGEGDTLSVKVKNLESTKQSFSSTVFFKSYLQNG